jgi:hypothetical protein
MHRNVGANGRPPDPKLPENEAIQLYEMNPDEAFHRTGRLVVDSSLGILQEGAAPCRDQGRRPHDRPH